MNRRKLILALGVLPLTVPVHAGRAASGFSVEQLVASPPSHIHQLNAAGYCPICNSWVSGPTSGASLSPGVAGGNWPNTLEPMV